MKEDTNAFKHQNPNQVDFHSKQLVKKKKINYYIYLTNGKYKCLLLCDGELGEMERQHVYVFVLYNNSLTCGLSKIFVLEASKGGSKLLPAVLMLMH